MEQAPRHRLKPLRHSTHVRTTAACCIRPQQNPCPRPNAAPVVDARYNGALTSCAIWVRCRRAAHRAAAMTLGGRHDYGHRGAQQQRDIGSITAWTTGPLTALAAGTADSRRGHAPQLGKLGSATGLWFDQKCSLREQLPHSAVGHPSHHATCAGPVVHFPSTHPAATLWIDIRWQNPF